MSDTEYKYSGQPLTATIAAELIQELFAGQIAERHKIVDLVIHTHRTRGGLNPRGVNTTLPVKKALSNLLRSGAVANPSLGQWRIAAPNGVAGPAENVPPLVEKEDVVVPPPADVVRGEGEDSVYLYYYESYRRLALLDGQQCFPCKVGRSERDPILRVLSQAATALPEYPKIARLFRTVDGSSLEAAIHGILSLRGKEVEDSPGSEWFLTTPDEVDEIFSFIIEDKKSRRTTSLPSLNDHMQT